MPYSCTHMATVGVKGLSIVETIQECSNANNSTGNDKTFGCIEVKLTSMVQEWNRPRARPRVTGQN